jgi:tetratricopeptide (TPR) repeat protein
MKWRYSEHLFASLGELWLARGNPAEAEEHIRHCTELAKRRDSLKYVARAFRLQGEVEMAKTDFEAAEQQLNQALALSLKIGQPTEIRKTHEALGRPYFELSRTEPAERSCRAALEVLENLKAHTQNSGPLRRAGRLALPQSRPGAAAGDPDLTPTLPTNTKEASHDAEADISCPWSPPERA